MMFRYFPDTDMLYIELIRGISTESEEVTPGIVLDFDDQNQVIGLQIEDASKRIDLSRLEVSALPIASLIFSATPDKPDQTATNAECRATSIDAVRSH